MNNPPCYQRENRKNFCPRKPASVPSPEQGARGSLPCRLLGLSQRRGIQQGTWMVPTHIVPHSLELLGQQAHLVLHRALLQGQGCQFLPQAFQLNPQPPQLLHGTLPKGLLGHPTPRQRRKSKPWISGEG